MTSVTPLNPPRPVLLTRHESSLLNGNNRIQRIFRSWGMSISESFDNGSGGPVDLGLNEEYVQVFVHSLPEVVKEKVWETAQTDTELC